MLWGIAWSNVELMLADAARIVDADDPSNVEKRELNTKEDIINYIKGLKG